MADEEKSQEATGPQEEAEEVPEEKTSEEVPEEKTSEEEIPPEKAPEEKSPEESPREEPEKKEESGGSRASLKDNEEGQDKKEEEEPAKTQKEKQKDDTEKKDAPAGKTEDVKATGYSSPQGFRSVHPNASYTPRSPRTRTGADSRSRERKTKEFMKEELRRVKTSFRKITAQIERPHLEPYRPFVWNSLAPYYSTYSVQFLLDLPEEARLGYNTRQTAIGLTDPEVSWRMDHVMLPMMTSRPMTEPAPTARRSYEPDTRPPKAGSTHLPMFPKINYSKTETGRKEIINYGEVPKLRQELKEKYGSGATERRKEDYRRTKQDFYRMELDKLKYIHPINRGHMKAACTTYLGTTPGSQRAISMLAKVLD
ncbi:neurofilament heavy polypeptide-like [Branchiostoma lanceolatum]|uniref:neurofilament heavy polypeptide-like n=1 Tax=Branchiostoma lanceolatum TaxID=7740 RepID=UPI0034515A19